MQKKRKSRLKSYRASGQKSSSVGKREAFRDKEVPSDSGIRLNKYLSNSGLCSRREADQLIQRGCITVNRKVVKELGTKVVPNDDVMFKGEKLKPENKSYILMNKPKDVITTANDPQGRRTVFSLFKPPLKERVYPVGRLDRMTTGILLLTNDGKLTKQLTHPGYGKKKIYQVSLDRPVTKADLERVNEGITLDDGFIKADGIHYIDANDKKEIGIEIHSGRNRIIRRIFEHLGYNIRKLDRVYFAGLTKKGLPRGKWRYLSDKEISILKRGSYE